MIRKWIGTDGPVSPYRLNRESWQARNLIFWFPMQGDTGSDMRDRSPYRHAVSGGSATRPSLAVGIHRQKARLFSQTSATYLDYGQPPIVQSGMTAFTVSLWLYPTNVTGNHFGLPNQWGAVGAGNAAWCMATAGTSVFVYCHNGAATDSIVATNALTINQWVHLVGTYRGGTTGSNGALAVNGKIVKTDTLSIVPQISTNYNVRIGMNANGTYPIDGRMMDVRVYKRGMTNGEMMALYNPQTRWDLFEPIRTSISVPYLPFAAAALNKHQPGGHLFVNTNCNIGDIPNQIVRRRRR